MAQWQNWTVRQTFKFAALAIPQLGLSLHAVPARHERAQHPTICSETAAQRISHATLPVKSCVVAELDYEAAALDGPKKMQLVWVFARAGRSVSH